MRTLQKLWTATKPAVPEGSLVLAFLVLSVPALAHDRSATLKIKVGIVQCGKTADLEKTCRQDSRCCALLDRQTASRANANNRTGQSLHKRSFTKAKADRIRHRALLQR